MIAVDRRNSFSRMLVTAADSCAVVNGGSISFFFSDSAGW